ncbi:uracil-DNA glycosylase-like protein [Pisolithus croceorrhizus]|nr:uracil-DNA glycosylase-like protein [Pisolithus croceorrhizus]
MSEEKRVVYLEDVENTTSTVPSASQESTKSASSTSVAASGKRQRSLLDMLAGSQGSRSDKNTGSAVKKQKLSSGKGVLKITASSTSIGQSVQRLNYIPFSLSEYTESLSEEHKRLLQLECECMGKSWLKLLKDEIKKPYFIALKKFLWEAGVRGAEDSVKGLKVYPSPRNIYSWSKTPLGKVKVVIVGQDPYHGPNQAHVETITSITGLCFSVPKGVSIPPSLRNIYAEIKSEYPDFQPPTHGNLTTWAENGVLMLNTCLTVQANEAGSHSGKGWEQFTDKVVDVVDKYGGANLSSGDDDSDVRGIGRGVVFLAWGAWAAKRVAKLNKVRSSSVTRYLTDGRTIQSKHLILSSAHPSPLSAHRGFLGNGHFKAANDWLENKYGPEGKVNWCQLD